MAHPERTMAHSMILLLSQEQPHRAHK
jgi:hypothetical protein